MNRKKTIIEKIISAARYIRTEWREVVKYLSILFFMLITLVWAIFKSFGREDLASNPFFSYALSAFLGIVVTLLYCEDYFRDATKTKENAKADCEHFEKELAQKNDVIKESGENFLQVSTALARTQSALKTVQEENTALKQQVKLLVDDNSELSRQLNQAHRNISNLVAENHSMKNGNTNNTVESSDTPTVPAGKTSTNDTHDISDIDEILKIFGK